MRKSLSYALAVLLASAGVSALAFSPGAGTLTPAKVPAHVAEDEETPLQPANVSELAISWNILEGGFDISMIAPTTGSYYDYDEWITVTGDLTDIEKIEVCLDKGYWEDPEVLHTFVNPAPGEALSYRETSLAKGSKYDFRVIVYANGETSGGATVSEVLAGAVPAAVSNVRVETDKGQMPVNITFTAPSVYAGSDIAIPSLDKVVLSKPGGWYSDPEELAVLSDVEPGKEYALAVNKEGLSGANTWQLVAYGADGPSAPAEVKVYIGVDTPGKVENVAAVEQADGNVLLTWDAPSAGANNGYFERDQLKYTVIVKTPGENSWNENSLVLSENQTECSYLYECAVAEPTKLRFSVKAVTDAGAGVEANSGYLIVGPSLSLPFTEGFDNKVSDYSWSAEHMWGTATNCNTSFPPDWRCTNYAYIGNTQVKPEGEEGGLMYIDFYDYTPLSDFWLVSSKINVEGEAALAFAYSYYVPETNCGNTGVGVQISFDNGLTYTTLHYTRFADMETKGWNKAMAETAVPAGAKDAVIRIVANNDPKAIPVIVDAISLKAAEAPQEVYPASVTGFTAAMDTEKKCVQVRLTAPLKSHPSLGDVNNEPLRAISKIVLSRQIGYDDFTVVHTFDNPAPGAELLYEDTDLEQGGSYRYRAVVYVGELCDYGNYTDESIMVGQVPGEVTDFTASSTQGMAPVVLRFRTPATDNAQQPLETVKAVVITRYNTDTFVWDEIGRLTDGLEPGKMYSYEDRDVTVGNIYEYRVTVEGTAGNSYGVSRSVFVGMDEPVEPSDIVATLGEDGRVTVTWTAPTEGRNGGYIDTEHLTYVVQRGNGYSDYDAVMLNDKLTETTFTDPTQFEEEEIVKYFVKAVSAGIAGYSAVSNQLLVGRPSSLPFVENFDRKVGDYIQAEHSSWTITSSEESPVWAFAEMAYFINEGQVLPVDGGNGLAYAYYGHYNTNERDDYLTSGNIDVTSAPAPHITFNVYGVPGTYGHSLDVEISFDGDDFTSIQKLVYYLDFDEEGWHNFTLPINKPAGAEKMQIRFHAHKAAYSCSVAVDNVRVDADGAGIASVTPVSGALVASVDGNIVVTGASADEAVTVADMAGRLVHTGTGDCKVAVAQGTYVVKVGAVSVKLLVK